eukprot:scaffold99966_cov18-Phaeocystis_antarctica.AAC.1
MACVDVGRWAGSRCSMSHSMATRGRSCWEREAGRLHWPDWRVASWKGLGLGLGLGSGLRSGLGLGS